MTRFFGPLRVSNAALLCSVAIPIFMTGCVKSMVFPSASVMPSYNESPIQLTAGQFRPVVLVSEIRDTRSDAVAGAVGTIRFKSDHQLRGFIKNELEGRLSAEGVALARSQEEAQNQSHSVRDIVVSIRSTAYGGASMLTHKTVAGISILIQVNDENGQPVFAKSYFGSADKYPVLLTKKHSGELMASAVRQAVEKAVRESSFRATIGL
jgi:hypothetical protein